MYDKKREQYVYSESIWSELLKQNQKSFNNERLKQLIQSVMKNIEKHNFHGESRKNGNGKEYGKRSYHHNKHMRGNNTRQDKEKYKEKGNKSFGGTRFKSIKTREYSDIYGLLNKLTYTTYDKIKSEFLQVFSNNEMDNLENEKNIKNKQSIFSIIIQESCNNILHIHLYAKLIYEIIIHHRECLDYYKERVYEFKEKVKQSQSIESITDYDILCKINKENECIKGFCILNLRLFIYLCINSSFQEHDTNILYDFIGYLFESLESCIDKGEHERMNAICGFVHKMFVLESNEIYIFINKDKENEDRITNILNKSIEKCSMYIRCHMKLTDIHRIITK